MLDKVVLLTAALMMLDRLVRSWSSVFDLVSAAAIGFVLGASFYADRGWAAALAPALGAAVAFPIILSAGRDRTEPDESPSVVAVPRLAFALFLTYAATLVLRTAAPDSWTSTLAAALCGTTIFLTYAAWVWGFARISRGGG